MQITSTIASGTIPHLEDLDTDGEGARYTSSTYNMGGMDFFERSASNPAGGHSASFTFSPPQGGAFWASEDIGSPGNPLGDHGILRLQNLDATGLSNLQVSVYLGELAATGEGPEDKIEIQYAFDGDVPVNPTDLSSGNYATVGRFVPSSPDLFTPGPMTLDRDLDGVTLGDSADDAPLATLSPTMGRFTFDIPATGNTLSVQIRIQQNGGSEELAFDHIEVTGSAVTGTPPTLANIESSALSVVEGDPGLPLTLDLTVNDPDPSLIASATVRITGNFAFDEDILSDDGNVPATITVTPFNPGTGTLTLDGPATPADFQSALRAITYRNTDVDNPSTAIRTVSLQAIDGDGNPSNIATREIEIIPDIPTGVPPVTEDFETDGNGERYIASSFNTGSLNSFFERVTANPDPRHTGGFTFTAPQDGAFWASEDVANASNPLGDHGVIRLQDLAVTNWTDLEVTVYLAQGPDKFDLKDKIEIQYALDADGGGANLASGTYTTIGRFVGNTIDIFGDGPMTADADLNGTADAGGVVLTSTMTAYTFDIPATGDLLSVQVRVEQNGASEDLAIDHLTVTGVPPTETVLNGDDGGPGSLRQAIADSVDGGFILFDPSLDGAEISLTTGPLVLDKDLTIDASALTAGLTISGGGLSRVFEVAADSSVALHKLTVADGAAADGGGIFNSGTLTITDSTITGNSTSSGIFGGGIYNLGTLEVLGCTFQRNSAAGGGALASVGPDASLKLTNVTVTDNHSANVGGGIYSLGTVSLQNTIVAGNTALNSGPDLLFAGGVGVVSSLGGNIVGDNSSTGSSFPFGNPNTNGDFVGSSSSPLDPLLGDLSANGGPTLTHALLPGSRALDSGTAAPLLLTDQRGGLRVRNASIDIGSYESAPTLVVTTAIDENDGGPGGTGLSLREAIDLSTEPDGNRIVFDRAVFDGQPADTITLGLGELVISGKTLEIDGASGGSTGVTVSGNNTFRVINILGGSDVTMRHLTITAGSATQGGGIQVSPGDNVLHLSSSTITGNTATGAGGGILNFNATSFIENCTITNNSADFGGGIENNSSGGRATIVHSTITGNTAVRFGGGLSAYNGTTFLHNSVIAGNTAATAPDVDSRGPLTPLGNNLIGDNTDSTAFFPTGLPNANGDYVGSPGTSLLDPQLDVLGNYGGPTQTRRPRLGSQTIDAALSCPLATDQRGARRSNAAAADIGAVEAQQMVRVDIATDDGDDPFGGGLSLREAIDFADPVNPVITFSPRLDGETIVLGGTSLRRSGGTTGLSIDASSLPRGLTIDADKKSRGLTFDYTGPVVLTGLTITGGAGRLNATFPSLGGGVFAIGTDLTVNRCTIHGNYAGNYGGGLLSASGTTTINESTISGNKCDIFGGGLYSEFDQFQLNRSTVTNNIAPPANGSFGFGGGGAAVYGAAGAGSFRVLGSIIAGNRGGAELHLRQQQRHPRWRRDLQLDRPRALARGDHQQHLHRQLRRRTGRGPLQLRQHLVHRQHEGGPLHHRRE